MVQPSALMHEGALAGASPRVKPEAASPAAKLSTVTLAVENMTCGGCMRNVERALREVPGVIAARANLSARRVTVTFPESAVKTAALTGALQAAGFKSAELAPETVRENTSPTRPLLARMAVAGFAAANIMLLSVSVWSSAAADDPIHDLFHWLSAVIAVPTVAYAGQPFFRSAWGALKNLRMNMDVPISLAILLSTGMSFYQTFRGSDQVYFDAGVTLLFFLLIGRYLDQRVRVRAKGAAENLLGLKAQWANVVSDDGLVERLPARLVTPGMLVAVASGESFPADGTIERGAAEIDESLITGETMPRSAAPGDVVYAGAINLGAPVTIRATAAEADTLLSQIARLMETAEQARGRYVRLADRAARYYAPLVHGLALTSFIAWMIAGSGWEAALTIAVAVLIITCPCALALAVPAVQVAASARLFDKGILLKAADGLERFAEVDTIVFDKTGTMTAGVPVLQNAENVDPATLRDAAALAAASRHPYAQAVFAAAKTRFGLVPLASGVEEVPGAGLRREGPNGEERLGSSSWCGVEADRANEASLWYAAPGCKPFSFSFEDRVREDASEVVSKLKAASFNVCLLSGDRERSVAATAREAGIADWRAALKPQDKIAALDDLKGKGHRLAMIGDGLNDAPALAAAHASLSPSTAADISQTASDAVFQGAKLAPVLELIAVARKTKRMAFQNFAIAFGYNLIFVPLAMAGLVTPLVAAIAMSSSSILVTINALRLRTMRLEFTK